jgi:hypothetical protein
MRDKLNKRITVMYTTYDQGSMRTELVRDTGVVTNVYRNNDFVLDNDRRICHVAVKSIK